jgi:hypothetical protein
MAQKAKQEETEVMATTVIGQVVTSAGLTQHANALGGIDRVAWTPASAYLDDQPADVPVHFAHDRTWRLGSVGHLERSERWGLLAVAVLDADVGDMLAEHRWYFSDGISCIRHRQRHDRSGVLIHELSLVAETASCGTRPIVAVPGDIRLGTAPQPRTMPLDWDDTWQRADEAIPSQRFRRSALHLVDLDPPTPVAEPPAPTGPTVNWYGTELGGELAQAVVDAIDDGTLSFA